MRNIWHVFKEIIAVAFLCAVTPINAMVFAKAAGESHESPTAEMRAVFDYAMAIESGRFVFDLWEDTFAGKQMFVAESVNRHDNRGDFYRPELRFSKHAESLIRSVRTSFSRQKTIDTTIEVIFIARN